MSANRYIEVLKEKPIVKPKGEVTVADKILEEYLSSGAKYASVPHSAVANDYKNPQSLARVLGKSVKKRELKGITIFAREKDVCILKE